MCYILSSLWSSRYLFCWIVIAPCVLPFVVDQCGHRRWGRGSARPRWSASRTLEPSCSWRWSREIEEGDEPWPWPLPSLRIERAKNQSPSLHSTARGMVDVAVPSLPLIPTWVSHEAGRGHQPQCCQSAELMATVRE